MFPQCFRNGAGTTFTFTCQRCMFIIIIIQNVIICCILQDIQSGRVCLLDLFTCICNCLNGLIKPVSIISIRESDSQRTLLNIFYNQPNALPSWRSGALQMPFMFVCMYHYDGFKVVVQSVLGWPVVSLWLSSTWPCLSRPLHWLQVVSRRLSWSSATSCVVGQQVWAHPQLRWYTYILYLSR